METKLYNVMCWYEDVFYGWCSYVSIYRVGLQEAEDFVKSKEHSEDVYEIVEVEL